MMLGEYIMHNTGQYYDNINIRSIHPFTLYDEYGIEINLTTSCLRKYKIYFITYTRSKLLIKIITHRFVNVLFTDL